MGMVVSDAHDVCIGVFVVAQCPTSLFIGGGVGILLHDEMMMINWS